MYLSVVIPAYNEEKRLPKTLQETLSWLSGQDLEWELIVVNDGSKDRTSQVVREYQKEFPSLRLIDNKENRGKGFVVRQGLLEARGEIRLFMDADNSTPVSEFRKLEPFFGEGYDIVIGSRDKEGAVLDPPQTLLRRFLGDLYSLLARLIVGVRGIKDTQCGFKAFRKGVVEEILPLCRIDRWSFDPEILVLAQRKGFKIKEVGVYWKNDPDSKVKFSGMVKALWEMVRIRWNLISGVYER